MDNKLFICAGDATFTIDNGKGQHFTYKAVKSDRPGQWSEIYRLIFVLTGRDNTRDYTYLGILDTRNGHLLKTVKSKIGFDAPSWKVAAWIFAVVWGSGKFPNGYSFQHAGHCGRCGKKLTDSESLRVGIGPTCRAEMGI